MNTRELKIIIKADGSTAVEEINKLDQGLDDLGRETQKTGQSLVNLNITVDQTGKSLKKTSEETKKAKLSWADFATGVNQAWEALGKGKQLLAEGWDVAFQGAKLQEARQSFDDYTRSIGQNAEDILGKLRKASGGTISDMGLITTASKAMSLGVTTDSGKMANLLEIARNKARLFGIDTSQAFEDIVTGLGRNSPLILDNLGIKIPAGFEEMTDGMSDADKTAKLLELTLIEGNKQLKEMGGLSNNSADEMRAFSAEVANLKGEFGILLSEGLLPVAKEIRALLPDIKAAIEQFRIFAAVANVPGQIAATLYYDEDLKKYPTSFEDAQQKYYEVNDRITELVRKIREEGASARPGPMTRASIGANSYQKELDELLKYSAQLEMLIWQLDDTRLRFNDKLNGFNSQELGLDDLSDEIDSMMDDFDYFASSLGSLDKDVNKSTNKTGKSIRETSGHVRSLKADFQELGTSAIKSLDLIEDGFDAFDSEVDRLLDNFDDSLTDMEKIAKKIHDDMVAAEIKRYKDLAGLDKNTAQWGYLNFMSSGYLNAWTDGEPLVEFQRKDKKELEQTIAEAITQGFANADLSNFSMTLGQMLSSILLRSVAQSKPILNSSGSVNWGNVGLNIGANLAISALTQPGRFFGGRQEKFKTETIQAATDLKSKMGQAWVQSFETSLLPYLSWWDKNELAAGRYGYYGTQTGYSWNDSGDGWRSDKTRTYNLIDQGASAALAKLTQAIENAERYNRSVEMGYELQAAQGLDYQALVAQEAAYRKAAATAYGGVYNLNWTDGTKDTADLAEAAHEIKMAAAELAMQLGQAKADRSGNIAQGFAKYMPWLDTIQAAGAIPSNLRLSMRSFQVPGLVGTDSLSAAQQYDAFAALQTSLMDRNIPSYLLDMVKQAGTAQYELEELKITDPDEYTERYLEQVEKQLSAFEEVVRRQEQIFNDAAKSYEERVAALDVYEQSMESYHQAKLEKLRTEKQLEEQEKQLMAEARQAKMESALSLIGEVSQRGDRIMIIQGGDSATAIKELMAEFADNPEVVAVLQSTLEKTEAKARWG